MSKEFSFPYNIRMLPPAEPVRITVLAQIDEENAGACEIGFDLPVGIPAEALSKIALMHYDFKFHGIAWEKWREQRALVFEERREAGVAGTEPSEEAS